MYLLDFKLVRIIQADHESLEDRYFYMFSQWLDTDSTACYCKLIDALQAYGHNRAAEKVKDKITTVQ